MAYEQLLSAGDTTALVPFSLRLEDVLRVQLRFYLRERRHLMPTAGSG